MSRISEATKEAVIAQRAAGISNVDIARTFNWQPVTTSRIWSAGKAAVEHEKAQEAESVADFTVRLRERAISSVLDGLQPREELVAQGCDASDFDLYKRAALGFKVLEGVGEFRSTQINEHIHRFEQLPPDWQARYGYVGQGIEPLVQVTTIEAHDEDDD